MPRMTLPSTDRKRREHFDQLAAVPTRHHNNALKPRLQLIDDMIQRRPGTNMRIMKLMVKGSSKIRRMLETKRFNERDILVRQAQLLDDTAAQFADHALKRIKQKDPTTGQDTLNEVISEAKIKTEGLTTREVEDKIWQHMFSGAVQFFEKKAPDGKNIIEMLERLHEYQNVPKAVHEERKKHWNVIKKIESKLIAANVDPEINLMGEIRKIVRRTPLKTNPFYKQGAMKAKAMDIVVAASIYADLVLEKKGAKLAERAEKEKFWNYAYSEAMEKTYPLISDKEELLKEILNLATKTPTPKVRLPAIFQQELKLDK